MKIEDGGLYVLVLRLKKGQKIKAGKLPETYFSSGCYLYVGRAKRGLKKRLERHLRKDKKLFLRSNLLKLWKALRKASWEASSASW